MKKVKRFIACLLVMLMAIGVMPAQINAQTSTKSQTSSSDIWKGFDASKPWDERVYTQDQQKEVLAAQKMVRETAKYMTKENGGFYPENGFGSGTNGGDWSVLGINRSYAAVDQTVIDTYEKNMSAAVGGSETMGQPTDTARCIVGLKSVNLDPTNFTKANLMNGISDAEAVEGQELNGPVWALIAKNCGNYSMDETTVNRYIHHILDREITHGSASGLRGGWVFGSSTNGNPDDMTCMAIIALAPYADQEYKGEKIQAYIDRAITALNAVQNKDGSFGSFGSASNSEFTSWMLTALSNQGMDPMGTFDKDGKQLFVTDDGTALLDAVKAFYVDGGGFKHSMSESTPNGMGTDQCMYNIVAYLRGITGQKALFDMSDAGDKHDISVDENVAGGVITIQKSAAQGDIVKVEAKPAEGYELVEGTLSYTQKEGDITFDEQGRLLYKKVPAAFSVKIKDGQFTMPKDDVVVTATFKEKGQVAHKVTVVADGNGTLKADKEEAVEGESITLTADPEKGYALTSISIKDAEDKAITVKSTDETSYSFVMPAKGVTVKGVFSKAASKAELRQMLNETLKYIKKEIPNPTPLNDRDNKAVFVIAGLRGALYDGKELGDMGLETAWQDFDQWCKIWLDNLWKNEDKLAKYKNWPSSVNKEDMDFEAMGNFAHALNALGINPQVRLCTPISNSATFYGPDGSRKLTGSEVARTLWASMSMYQQQLGQTANNMFLNNRVTALKALTPANRPGFAADGMSPDLDTTLLMMNVLGYGCSDIQTLWGKYGDVDAAIERGGSYLEDYDVKADNTVENAKILTALNSHKSTEPFTGNKWIQNITSNYVEGKGFKAETNASETDLNASIEAVVALASCAGVIEKEAKNPYVIYPELEGTFGSTYLYSPTGVYLAEVNIKDKNGALLNEGYEGKCEFDGMNVPINKGFIRKKISNRSFTTNLTVKEGYVLYAPFNYYAGKYDYNNTLSSNQIQGVVQVNLEINKGYLIQYQNSDGLRKYDLDDLVTFDKPYATPGETVTLTQKTSNIFRLIDGGAGLFVEDGNGADVSLTKESDTTYTFTMPESNATVDADYEAARQTSVMITGSMNQTGIDKSFIKLNGKNTGTREKKMDPVYPAEEVVLPDAAALGYTSDKYQFAGAYSSTSAVNGNYTCYIAGETFNGKTLPASMKPLWCAEGSVVQWPIAAERTSGNKGAIEFYSSAEGEYWVEVTAKNAQPSFAADDFDIAALGKGATCQRGRNKAVVDLDSAAAKDVYILVKDAAGNTNIKEIKSTKVNGVSTVAIHYDEYVADSGKKSLKAGSAVVFDDLESNYAMPGDDIVFHTKSDRGIYGIIVPDSFKIEGNDTGKDYTDTMKSCEGSVDWKDSYLKVLYFHEFDGKDNKFHFPMPDEDITISYKTMSATYVEFNLNGVDADFNYKKASTYPVNYPFPLPPDPVDPTGEYKFLGWNYTANAKTALADDQVLVTRETSSSSIKFPFYAIWQKVNKAPTMKEGVKNPESADVQLGQTYKLNLTKIFEDPDRDDLTYKVSVNGGEAKKTDAAYEYTPDKAGKIKLAFTANDGQADSEQYIVTLSVDNSLVEEKDQAIDSLKSVVSKLIRDDYDEKTWEEILSEQETGAANIKKASDSDSVQKALNEALEAINKLAAKVTGTAKVCVSMDANVLGLGFIIEPTLVEVKKNEKASVVITDLLKKNGYTWKITGSIENGFYLAGVGPVDQSKATVADYIPAKNVNYSAREDSWLKEKNYTNTSGWKYAVGNEFPGFGASSCLMKNNNVMRWQFTVYGLGTDLAGESSFSGESDILRDPNADKDDLTWLVAEANAANKKTSAEYKEAMKILQNPNVIQSEIDAAYKALERAGSTPDVKAPAVPTSVKTSAATYNSMKLSWAKVKDAQGYQVQRATSKTGKYATIKTTTATSIVDTKLTSNKTYYYKVRAYTKNGTKTIYGALSSPVYGKTALPPPSSVKASSASYKSLKVSWTKVKDARGYKVYRATSKSGKYTAVKTTSSTSFTDTKRATGKNYYYKVRAYRKDGTAVAYGGLSKVVSAKPIPARPAGVKVKAGWRSAVVSWKKVSGATGYKLYKATKKSGKYSAVKTISKGSTTKYTNRKLKKGKVYYFKVRAYKKVNGKGVYSSYSKIVKVKVK